MQGKYQIETADEYQRCLCIKSNFKCSIHLQLNSATF